MHLKRIDDVCDRLNNGSKVNCALFPRNLCYLIWCISQVLHRNRTNRLCVCKVIQRERDFKELGSCNCRSWKIQNLQGSWQAGNPGESCSLSPKAICWQNSLFLQGGWYFSIKALMDWMRPIHITEGNPFHSKSTDSNDNLILKMPSQKHLE